MAARFAVVTDPHYARRPDEGDKRFADSLGKLRDAVTRFNAAGVGALVVLGDLVDHEDDGEAERACLLEVREALSAFAGEWRLTPGNHDLMNFDKAGLFALMGVNGPPCAIDVDGVRLLLLDGCHRPDGAAYAHGDFDWKQASVGGGQVDWLRGQLAAAEAERRRVVVCCHHPLICDDERYVVANADEVLDALAGSPAVAGYLCGHYHAGGDAVVRGLRHVTLRAMIGAAPNAMQGAIVVVDDQGGMRVDEP